METNEQLKNMYPNSWALLRWGVIIFILTTAFVVFMPIIITQNALISLEVDKPNEIGDTIGGILGPCVGLIAAALTFLAFWAQYDANIEQRKQFDQSLSNEKVANLEKQERARRDQESQIREFEERQKQFEKNQELQQQQILLQDKRARINLFETRFYAMLSIHRENAISIEVNKIKGQKVFLHMLDELKLLYHVFLEIYKESNKEEVVDFESVYNITYLSFFFGIGDKSTPIVKDLVQEPLVEFVEVAHNLIQTKRRNAKENNLDAVLFEFNINKYKWDRIYTLGVGHARRLSHYVRHLYQMVKLVDNQPDDLINQDTKYDYISNLRAQLSVHEQILLYYNAISVLGRPWLDYIDSSNENLIERYCMLKSIPLNAADFYKKPSEFFRETNLAGKTLFEWTEIRNRMQNLKR